MKIDFRIFSIVGILLFAYILYNSNISLIFSLLSQINYLPLIIGFLISFIAAFIKSEKWRLLLKIAKKEYSSFRAFIVWMISYAYGFITPARAGDFVRVFYLHHDIKLGKGKGFIICLLDRLLDLAALIFTSFIFYTMVFNFPQIIFLLTIAAVIGMYVLLYLTDRYIDVFPAKIKSFYVKSKDFVKSVFKHYTLPSLIVPFFMSVIAWFFSFSQMYFVILAFNKVLSFFLVGAGISLSTLISLLPVSIGGLGTTELVLFTIFSVFSMEEIVAMTFIFNLISLWLPAAIGFLLNMFNWVEMKL